MTIDNVNTKLPYTPLSLRMVVQLAAPHTWPAAILPVLLSVSLAFTTQHYVSVTLACALLIISILMQAAANTINDYYDFIKGTDTIKNQDDPTDAVLVYNNVNPRSVHLLALGFLALSLVVGIYIIVNAGWIALAIGGVGAIIILLYSAGKSPVSYLPLGELISGFAMGGMIPLACWYVLTGIFSWMILLIALPLIIGIGLIMFTNNTCDIEKDIEAGRKTLPVILGHTKAVKGYHVLMILWMLSIIVLVTFFFTSGLIVIPFMLLILYPTMQSLFANPLKPETRGPAMGTCLTMNIGLGAFYSIAILCDSIGFLLI